MAVNEIKSRDEAIQVAREFIARGEERAELVKQLHEEDMLGLECAGTVRLEKLTAEDAAAGWRLAKWLVMDAAKEST